MHRFALCLMSLLPLAAGSVLAAPAEEEGEVRLWVSATYTGVHTWDCKSRGAGPKASTTTERKQDKLVLRFCGTTTWRLREWAPESVTNNCAVTAEGAGRFIKTEHGPGVCSKHRDAPFTATDAGRWTYKVPAKGQDLGPLMSPAGVVAVTPAGTWMMVLNCYPNCAEIAPEGSWFQRYVSCCDRKSDDFPIADVNDPPGQARALFLATDAYEETLSGGSQKGIAQGTWDTKKKGFFVSGRIRNSGGDRNMPFGEPPAGDPDAGYATGTEAAYWTADINYTISFSVKPPPVECVIETDDDYAGWLPEGGASEKQVGNKLHVSARLQVKGQPDKTPLQKARFRFELAERSREPGVAMNLPLANPGDDPDLRLQESPGLTVKDEGGSAETTSDKLLSAAAVIGCYDYGAYGKLRVVATLDDGSVVYGHLQGQPGKEELTLPRDADGNRVADAWETAKHPATWDGETEPALDGTKGDGLTLYEEYRGLVHQGAIRRLSPALKDLVIVNQTGAAASAGLRLFEGAAGLQITELSAGELADDRVANPNHTFASGAPQHALRLVSETLPDGIIGMAYPDRIKSCPADCERTAINSNLSFLPAAARDGLLAAGIAHELGHSLGAQHHGDSGSGTTEEDLTVTAATTRVFDTAGQPIAERPYALRGLIETKSNGGESSGCEQCVMRNSSYFQWVKRVDRMGVANYYAVPPSSPGSLFCGDPAGTGLNAADRTPVSYFGNSAAGRGACLKQMRVNDSGR